METITVTHKFRIPELTKERLRKIAYVKNVDIEGRITTICLMSPGVFKENVNYNLPNNDVHISFS